MCSCIIFRSKLTKLKILIFSKWTNQVHELRGDQESLSSVFEINTRQNLPSMTRKWNSSEAGDVATAHKCDQLVDDTTDSPPKCELCCGRRLAPKCDISLYPPASSMTSVLATLCLSRRCNIRPTPWWCACGEVRWSPDNASMLHDKLWDKGMDVSCCCPCLYWWERQQSPSRNRKVFPADQRDPSRSPGKLPNDRQPHTASSIPQGQIQRACTIGHQICVTRGWPSLVPDMGSWHRTAVAGWSRNGVVQLRPNKFYLALLQAAPKAGIDA